MNIFQCTQSSFGGTAPPLDSPLPILLPSYDYKKLLSTKWRGVISNSTSVASLHWGRSLGTQYAYACQSMHLRKRLPCGDEFNPPIRDNDLIGEHARLIMFTFIQLWVSDLNPQDFPASHLQIISALVTFAATSSTCLFQKKFSATPSQILNFFLLFHHHRGFSFF